jgi:hypothetical protein
VSAGECFEVELGDLIDAEIARARLELLVAEADLPLVLWISRLIETALSAPLPAPSCSAGRRPRANTNLEREAR